MEDTNEAWYANATRVFPSGIGRRHDPRHRTLPVRDLFDEFPLFPREGERDAETFGAGRGNPGMPE